MKAIHEGVSRCTWTHG